MATGEANHFYTLEGILKGGDPDTYRHSLRVEAVAVALTKEMGLGNGFLDMVVAARFHDLGKVFLPKEVLHKPAPLTSREMALVREHPLLGARLLEPLGGVFKEAAPSVLAHHERWDGRGYPAGLKGEEIPLLARILAVADAYEAMTVDRPYRQALALEEALKMIREGAGSQWDPQVVEVFLDLVEGNSFEHPTSSL